MADGWLAGWLADGWLAEGWLGDRVDEGWFRKTVSRPPARATRLLPRLLALRPTAFSFCLFSFLLFCLALAFVGAAASFAQQYRFAAADSVTASWKPRAISFVLLGGVLAGFLGPRLSFVAKDWISDQQFAGSFLLISALGLVAMFFLSSAGGRLPTMSWVDRRLKCRLSFQRSAR